MTGLEPLIAKAASAGAQRASGWAAHQTVTRLKRRKLRNLIGAPAQRSLQAAIAQLSDDQIPMLLAFLSSAEFEHTATQLSRAYLVERCGKRSEEILAAARREFGNKSPARVRDDGPNLSEPLSSMAFSRPSGNSSTILCPSPLYLHSCKRN